MSTQTLYYTTIDNNTTGRASHFFRTKSSAKKREEDQNNRAEALGIKARYSVSEHDGDGVVATDIRD